MNRKIGIVKVVKLEMTSLAFLMFLQSWVSEVSFIKKN